MRNFIAGIIIGMMIGAPIAWAASNARIQSANGVAISAANPLPVYIY